MHGRAQAPTPDGDNVVAAFRAQCAAAQTYDDLVEALERAVTVLGAAGFMYWTARRDTVEANRAAGEFHRDSNMFAARGPMFLKAFEALYLRNRGLVMDDPTVDHGLETHTPFTTDDVIAGRTLSKRQKLNIRMMHRFGLHHDLYLPLHTPARYQLLYIFALGKAAEVGEALARARPWLARLGDIFVGSVADFVDLDRYEKSETFLSIREQECLARMARGMTNREIAGSLGVSSRTVKFHVDNLLRKLGASTRAEAVAVAARSNWLTN